MRGAPDGIAAGRYLGDELDTTRLRTRVSTAALLASHCAERCVVFLYQ